jgi:uncharacterized RDD family membrane protein YckC
MNNTVGIASATGVDLQLNIAGPGARSYAFVIDWHIRLLLALAWFLAMHIVLIGAFEPLDADNMDFAVYVYLVIVPSGCLYFLYHPVLEIFMRGLTPGKRIAGVRIVTMDGQEPGLLAHLIRNLLRLLDSLPVGYVVGLVAAAVTEKSVRIGDMAAGTVLVYDSDARGEKLDAMPVNAAAVTRLGLDRAELCQDLLNRWDELEREKRHQLAVKLLSKLDPAFRDDGDTEDLRAKLQREVADEGRD